MKKVLWLGIALAALVLFNNDAQARDFNAGPIWNNNHAKKVCPGVCARHNHTWNGNWKTTVPRKMSVCGCNPRANLQRKAKQVRAKMQRKAKQHRAKMQRKAKQHRAKLQRKAKQARPKCFPRHVCWWMNPRIGNKWVTTQSALGRAYTLQQCYQANSCGCGGKRSGGGCYKWARCVGGKGIDFCKMNPGSACRPGDKNAGPIWNNNDAKGKCPRTCAAHKCRWNGQWKTTVPGRMSVCGCVR